MDLIQKLEKKEVNIGVIGLGYVGLPLAVEFAKKELNVIGFEMNQKKCEKINSGINYIKDVVDEELEKSVKDGFLTAYKEFDRLPECDFICIAVPTPLDRYKQPDISYVQSVSKEISQRLRKNQVIILESTTYPGTTEEVILPELEASGKKVGEDFFLAFSPERVDPGNPVYKTGNTPKVVGGVTKKCTELAAKLYETFNPSIHKVSSPKVAEMEKLLENIFRIVNISMINELALLSSRMDIDIWEVINAAKTKPYGFMPFYPGPGLGGHCIPIDPFYLSWKAKEYDFYTRFIELAGEINNTMPHYVVTKCIYALNKHQKCLNGSKVLILGFAYKENIDDDRETPVRPIIEDLWRKHAVVEYNDPHIEEVDINGEKLKSVELTPEKLKSADLVLITTAHSAYDPDFILKHSNLIVDTRNLIKTRGHDNYYYL